ncbi:hypothetical protein BDR07DRAFT_1492367 [Suillus spraguei]|nr:hypothetical protein BDR07DRAFT_1492367 [Suillus spraguei]
MSCTNAASSPPQISFVSCKFLKLDKEKGRTIESLEAPDFKRNASTDLIRQRAVEREHFREASQNARPGTIKRMQFTSSINAPPCSFPATSSSSYTFSGEGSTPPSQTSGLALSSERVAGAGEVTEPLVLTMPLPTPASNQNCVSSSATNDSSYEKFIASYEKTSFSSYFQYFVRPNCSPLFHLHPI